MNPTPPLEIVQLDAQTADRLDAGFSSRDVARAQYIDQQRLWNNANFIFLGDTQKQVVVFRRFVRAAIKSYLLKDSGAEHHARMQEPSALVESSSQGNRISWRLNGKAIGAVFGAHFGITADQHAP